MVWAEYDKEKAGDAQLKSSTREVTKATILALQPLAYSRILKFEVWHDSCMPGEDGINNVYLGEAEAELDIDAKGLHKVYKHEVLPLKIDPNKTIRKAAGEIEFEYTWEPHDPWSGTDPVEPGTLLKGELTVTVIGAAGLPSLDWKGNEISDPFVQVLLYPASPGADGEIIPKVSRTSSIFDIPEPVWNQAFSFQFHWRRDGVLAKQEMDRKQTQKHGAHKGRSRSKEDGLAQTPTQAGERTPTSPVCAEPQREPGPLCSGGDASLADARLLGAISALSSDVFELRAALPALRQEVGALQEGAKSILSRLHVDVGDSCRASVERSAVAAGSSWDAEPASQSPAPPVVSSDLRPEDRCEALGSPGGSTLSMPGAVPDDPCDLVASKIHPVSPSHNSSNILAD